MSRFAKLRELVTLARNLESEGRRLSPGESRTVRFVEADGYRAKAEWLAGRITRDEYMDRLVECADARAYPVD
jgi:hypothetical protein